MTRKYSYVAEKKRLEREADERRTITDEEREDLGAVLSTKPGRALYYRLVFLVGCIEDPTFAANIKDGVSAAMHHSFGEGVRAVAITLRDEARELFPELWELMLDERKAHSRLNTETQS